MTGEFFSGVLAHDRPRRCNFLRRRDAICYHDKDGARAYMGFMRKVLLFTPLFALLIAAFLFTGSVFARLGVDAIPLYGWIAIAGGVGFSLLVGGGLMALVFYSNRHGYDDLSSPGYEERSGDIDE